jgi:phosphatidylserine/phosphatidylglycerophosphate/cardiolipin synthase-like enzyme
MNAKQTHKMAGYLIMKALKTIVLTCFTFDLAELLELLIAASKRGIRVTVCADEGHTYTGRTTFQAQRMQELYEGGVKVILVKGANLRDEYSAVGRDFSGRGIQHSKTLLVDRFLLCGSTNWTTSSKGNFELSLLQELSPLGLKAYEDWVQLLFDAGVRYTEATALSISDAKAAQQLKRTTSGKYGVIGAAQSEGEAVEDPYRTARRFTLARDWRKTSTMG